MKIGNTDLTGSYNHISSKSKASPGARIDTRDTFRSVSNAESEIDLKRAAELLLKQRTGKEESVWKYEGKRSLTPVHIGEDGKLFLTDYWNSVIALDGRSGFEYWNTKPSGPIERANVGGDDGTIYGVSRGPNRIFSFDTNKGKINWSNDLENFCLQSPVPGKYGLVYVASNYNGRLAAFDSRDGKKKWDIQVKKDSPNDLRTIGPVVDSKGNLLVGSGDGTVYSVHGKKGKVLWKSETGVRTFHPPLLGGDEKSVYSLGYDGSITRIDTQKGRQIWKKDVSSEIISAKINKKDNALLLSCKDGKLRSFNGETGDMMWETKLSEWSSIKLGSFHPAGYIFVGTDKGKLAAIDLKTGMEVWNANPGNKQYGPPLLGPDNKLYVSGGDDKDSLKVLYALKLPGYLSDPEMLLEELKGAGEKAAKDIRVEDNFVVIGGVKLSRKQLSFMGINAGFFIRDSE